MAYKVLLICGVCGMLLWLGGCRPDDGVYNGRSNSHVHHGHYDQDDSSRPGDADHPGYRPDGGDQPNDGDHSKNGDRHGNVNDKRGNVNDWQGDRGPTAGERAIVQFCAGHALTVISIERLTEGALPQSAPATTLERYRVEARDSSALRGSRIVEYNTNTAELTLADR